MNPMKYEIINANYILIYLKHKLYCYSLNLLESKLIFKFCISDIFLFTYLQKKDEILFIHQKDMNFIRVNLEGEIKYDEKNVAKINFEEKIIEKKEKVDSEDSDEYIGDAYINNGNFDYLYGFNKDKYIFKYFGYYLSLGDPYDDYTDEDYNITILNMENMKEMFSDNRLDYSFLHKKLTDNLFIDEDGNESIVYYDDKENKIKFLNEIFKEGKYFSLDNQIQIAIFIQPDILYLVDFSKETKRSIKLNQSYNKFNLLNIGYFCEKESEYLFLLIRDNNFNCEIIKGKIV